MKTHVTGRIPLAVAVCLALAALVLGFPASASPDAPNPGHVWTELENHGTSGAPVDTYWLGTTTDDALELRVNNERALRLEPTVGTPNVIGGYSGNSVTPGVNTATVSGGGVSGDPCGWCPNRVTDHAGTVGGGVNNQAGDDAGSAEDAWVATVGGGSGNTASGPASTVGGGSYNTASSDGATVGGGDYNAASGSLATVGGGKNNTASGGLATVGGGNGNTASGSDATVGGGYGNTASDYHATVGGGWDNTASDDSATVAGGQNNNAQGHFATVAGGIENQAIGEYNATVGGGSQNTASGGSATVCGGAFNTASGAAATVAGGGGNIAAGDVSLAAGYRAKVDAGHYGTFLFADANDFDFNSAAANEFAVRSTGGARFVLGIDGSGNPTWTCSVSDGGTWSCSSSSTLKDNLVAADGRDILERLSDVPVFTWNAESQDPAVRHIGPMAEDFYAAFGVGEDDGRLATIDLDGVALAAIQGLYELSQEQAARVEALEDENASLRQGLDDLEARVTALEEGSGTSTLVSQGSSSGLPINWVLLSALVLGAVVTGLPGLVLVQRRLAGGRR